MEVQLDCNLITMADNVISEIGTNKFEDLLARDRMLKWLYRYVSIISYIAVIIFLFISFCVGIITVIYASKVTNCTESCCKKIINDCGCKCTGSCNNTKISITLACVSIFSTFLVLVFILTWIFAEKGYQHMKVCVENLEKQSYKYHCDIHHDYI